MDKERLIELYNEFYEYYDLELNSNNPNDDKLNYFECILDSIDQLISMDIRDNE